MNAVETIPTEARYHVPRSQTWPGSRGFAEGRVHLHVMRDVTFGRLTRKRSECLCPKKHGSYERPPEHGEFRCDDCARIAARYGLRWPT